MLDEPHERNLLGGEGLRGPDKSQGELRDVDATHGPPTESGNAGDRSAHQNAQHGADVRGKPSMVQQEEALPEGLKRERKGSYDKSVGRAGEGMQVGRTT